MGTFSIWHWLIVLVVVVLVFGSKKLVNVGPDLGKAIRGFQKSMRDGDKNANAGENAPALKTDGAPDPRAETAAAENSGTAEKTPS